jgi:hypothetical protein
MNTEHRLAALLALLAVSLPGHDLYLKPESGVVAPGTKSRVEYHNGDAFPKSQAPVKIERLRDTKRIAADGELPLTDLRVEGNTTIASFTAPGSGHFSLISRTIPNFIELAPDKFEKYLRHEGLGWVVDWRKKHNESAKPGRELYSKYVKSLLVAGKGDGSFRKPSGLTIEFVPLDDPTGAAPGSAVRLQLLLRGKPASGHVVEASWLAAGKVAHKHLGKTDAQGLITVPVPAAGFYKIHAIIMERREDRTQADWESFWATITFSTAHAPDSTAPSAARRDPARGR